MALRYQAISEKLQKQILQDRKNGYINPNRTNNSDAIRRNADKDNGNLWRPAYVRDIEKILHLPFYNRYADKTQVFSFYSNDDITRRALHVQLVSRIARNIGEVLGLNLDLIEAIALGHDIGHTPFGHAGERFLSEIFRAEAGRYFNHNVHSVRVLEDMFARNVSLQTLDGILCHNGEFEQQEYKPCKNKTFEFFDQSIENCNTRGKPAIDKLVPSTLEGCVVRICDMIAYIGKDRQDAVKAKIVDKDYKYKSELIGDTNAQIINNLTVDILENSYGKDYILLSKKAYNDLRTAKKENGEVIYQNPELEDQYNRQIKPMFEQMYQQLLKDVKQQNKASYIFTHHIDFINQENRYYKANDYLSQEPNQIVVDYISSMTDDYFVSLYAEMFPKETHKIQYKSYFEK